MKFSHEVNSFFEKINNILSVYYYDFLLDLNQNSATNWCGKGIYLMKVNKLEEALYCFCKGMEIDPINDIALKNRVICENLLIEADKEKSLRNEEEIRKKIEEQIKKFDKINEQENQRRDFNSNISKLIQLIEFSANEKPCPKCNEIEVFIIAVSPNARSLSVRCRYCNHEYRIIMNPEDPKKIIYLFNSFLDGKRIYSSYGKDTALTWQMKLIKHQTTNQRKSIPSSIKKAVWKRDGGKCVNCGSEIDLEYDHIIPVAKGGASTMQNIQILCRRCNRKKHASIE